MLCGVDFRFALKLKTTNQRAVFGYIYEHPDCTLQEIREKTGIGKDNCMHIIRELRREDLILYREDDIKHIRHYSANNILVDKIMSDFMKKLYSLFC